MQHRRLFLKKSTGAFPGPLLAAAWPGGSHKAGHRVWATWKGMGEDNVRVEGAGLLHVTGRTGVIGGS